MWSPLLDDAPNGLEHDSDRSLVVRTKDRSAGIPHDPVLDHRLERPVGGNRVEVRAEEDRRSFRGTARDTAVDVAHRRAD